MNNPVIAIISRELRLGMRQPNELLQPLFFMVLVATLFPMAVGPNPVILQKIGAGIIWVTAMLSLLIGLDQIFRQDHEDGTLEQYMLSPQPLWLICFLKVVCHWLMTALPLLILSPVFALFFKLTWDMYIALLLTLLLGTPILSFLGAIGVSLTLGLNKSGALLGLLILPLFIPVLIFATSAIDAAVLQLPYTVQLAWIGVILMMVLALAPFTISFGLRVSQE